MNGLLESAEKRMKGALDALRQAFSRIRTGRASPSLLDDVMVDYYGTPTAVNQVASIIVENARSMVITPWEKPIVEPLEKAILAANLGITPNVQGDVIRLNLPQLTEETRNDYARKARVEAEQARVAIRNIRRDTNASLKNAEDGQEKDVSHRLLNQVQTLTDKYIASVEDMLKAKEEELSEF